MHLALRAPRIGPSGVRFVASEKKAGPFSAIQRMGNVLADQSYPLVSMTPDRWCYSRIHRSQTHRMSSLGGAALGHQPSSSC